jgi:hypothetical protein
MPLLNIETPQRMEVAYSRASVRARLSQTPTIKAMKHFSWCLYSISPCHNWHSESWERLTKRFILLSINTSEKVTPFDNHVHLENLTPQDIGWIIFSTKKIKLWMTLWRSCASIYFTPYCFVNVLLKLPYFRLETSVQTRSTNSLCS